MVVPALSTFPDFDVLGRTIPLARRREDLRNGPF
jgi:hypothetical protein